MKTIHKSVIEVSDEVQTITMPNGGTLVHVHEQGSVICIWFIVDTDKEHKERLFRVFGTGHAITDDHWRYVATVHIEDMVWHLHEWSTAGSTFQLGSQ